VLLPAKRPSPLLPLSGKRPLLLLLLLLAPAAAATEGRDPSPPARCGMPLHQRLLLL
jgi:hypothetical protein